jgi:cytochrome c2
MLQKKILLAALVISSYIIGAASYKERYFPIPQLSKLVKNSLAKIDPSPSFNDNSNKKPIDYKFIETSRIPLNFDLYAINDLLNQNIFKNGAGGLSKYGKEMLIIDGDTALYKVNENLEISKIDSPSLPSLKVKSQRAASIAYNDVTERIYVAYFDIIDDRNLIFRIASNTLTNNQNKITNPWRMEFKSEIINHKGNPSGGSGKILLADNFLYFGIGSFSSTSIKDESINPQLSSSSVGKVFKLNLATGSFSVYTLGHRNSQGMTFSFDGNLLAVEHGPQGGDELNMLIEGGNYGFPLKVFGTDYGNYDWDIIKNINAPKLNSSNFTDPLFSWIPSIAPSSIIQLSKFNSSWDGDFLVGTLKAQSIFRLRIINGRIIYSEPIWIGKRIRDLYQRNSIIYILTDDGMIGTLKPNISALEKNLKSKGAIVTATLSKCLTCHHIGGTTPSNSAPSLSGIINRRIATDYFLNYSNSLKSKSSENWTIDNIKLFLSNPQKFAPGTTMPNLNLKSEEIDEIVESLNKSAGLY